MVPETLSELYQQHVRERLSQMQGWLAELKYDALLISAGDIKAAFRDDVGYPFRVNPYFATWLPLSDRPGCCLLITLHTDRPKLFYFQPEDIWHQINPCEDASIQAAFEVSVVTSASHRQRELSTHSVGQRVAFIGETSPLDTAASNPADLLAIIDYHRAWKTPYEVACMRLANARAVKGHCAARAAFLDQQSEFGIHMAYLAAVGQLDEHLPYGNIVALNEHAAVLHYTQKLHASPVAHHSLLIDAGATVAGYAADITRTYAAAQPGTEFANLVIALEALQQEVVATVEVDGDFVALHQFAHQRLAQLLVEVGIVRGSWGDALELGLTRAFLPHGLGHLLGVQVHDRGGWMCNRYGQEQLPPEIDPYLRLTRRLSAGMVFTIEPGLYFIDALLQPLKQKTEGRLLDWALLERLRVFGGIRIEDNIHLTLSGPENLTRQAFADEMGQTYSRASPTL